MRLFIRDGDREEWEGRVKVDCRPRLPWTPLVQQNVKEVADHHCTATNVLHSCSLNCCEEHALFSSVYVLKWSSSGLAMLVYSLQCGAETFGS